MTTEDESHEKEQLRRYTERLEVMHFAYIASEGWEKFWQGPLGHALKGHLANTIFFEFALARFNCHLASSPHRAEPPWHQWPRPPGGFADLGCGNGLLTHVLTSEGYTGHGIDLGAHTSWAHYPPMTMTLLPAGSFLTGNHTDEPTPWGPLIRDARPRIQVPLIPCCAWALDAQLDGARDVP